MTDTPANRWRDAKALISDPENWNKDGDFFKGGDSRTGCMCVWGAVMSSASGVGTVRRIAVRELFRKALPYGFEGTVFEYNDDPNTTHPDMMAFLDRAIAIAEKHND